MSIPINLTQDQVDDAAAEELAERFVGVDLITKSTKLGPGQLRGGGNVWAEADLTKTRPGLRTLAALDTAALEPGLVRVAGMGYYDTPEIERIVAAFNGKLYGLQNDLFNTGAEEIPVDPFSTVAEVIFTQLVDRLWYCDGRLRWVGWRTDEWQAGSVTTFSNDDAMPFFSIVVAHKFRLLAVEKGGDRIYVAAIGSPETNAAWVKTEMFRVGKGEGDPITALVVAPTGDLYAIKGASVWALDTSAASVADWTSRPVTELIGCIAGRTAMAVGQDVLFLTREGVMSLAALSTTDSISAMAAISAPIAPYAESINWAAIGTAWAVMWQSLYLLAVPIDDADAPNALFCFNTITKQWQTPWYTAMPGRDLGEDVLTFEGFTAAVMSRFGGQPNTILADNAGRIWKLDPIIDKDDIDAAEQVDIESWCLLKSWDFDAPEAYKQPLLVELEWYRGTGRGVQVNLIKETEETAGEAPQDESMPIAAGIQTSSEIVSNLATNSLQTFPIRFPLQLGPRSVTRLRRMIRELGRFRECSLQVVCAQGRMQLRSARMLAYVDTPILQP